MWLPESFIKCGAMTETYREIKAETDRERGGWNANFCHLSPAAGLAVWHMWWMVLHWYCCPLTSAHCHWSTDKGEEKNPAVRALDASFHQHLHTHRYMQAHTQQLPSPSANTLVQTSKHTHMHTHTLTLITCILLQYVFAEQSWFPSAWLTSFCSLHRPSPPTSDATITHPCESTGFWEYAETQVHYCKLHICCTLRWRWEMRKR